VQVRAVLGEIRAACQHLRCLPAVADAQVDPRADGESVALLLTQPQR
jgi:hypothetical protein